MGWLPASITVAIVCLDSGEVRETLTRNRPLLSAKLLGDPSRLIVWAGRPGGAPPSGRTLVSIDMRRVRGIGLIPTVLGGRRAAPAYRDCADAAAALRAGR